MTVELISWHEEYIDPFIGNLSVGKLGAMKYILDKPGGKPITRGYHEFFMHQGTLMGKIGNNESRIYYEYSKFSEEQIKTAMIKLSMC